MTWDYNIWYKKNRSILSKKRKMKYKGDAEYRKNCRRRSLNYYHSRRKRIQPVDRHSIRSADNKVYFTIGRVARLINRTVGRIREYHKSGVIPNPMYYDKRGWRLYTRWQAVLLQEAFKEVDLGDWSLEDLKKHLLEHWEEVNGEEGSSRKSS